MEQRFGTGRLIAAVFVVMRGHAMVFGGAWLVLTALATLIDWAAPEYVALNFGMFVAQLFAQAIILRTVLTREGLVLRPPAPLRILGLFAVGIITGLGIIAGLLLLVVPGIYLAARWQIADAVLIAESAQAGDAVRASWERTGPHAWPIAAALVVLYAPLLVAALVLTYLIGSGAVSSWANLPANALVYAAMMIQLALTLAAYAMLRPTDSPLRDVFA